MCVCVCVSPGFFPVVLDFHVSAWACMYLFDILFSFLLGIHPEMELLDHIVDLFLIF